MKFGKNVSNWLSRNSAVNGPNDKVIAGDRASALSFARRIAIPLVLLGAGLVLIQPCAGQSGTWTATGSLATARGQYAATLLPHGPATGAWSATGSLATARYRHLATLLPSGKVLVAGGYGNSGPLASAELYDPATGAWSATGSVATSRYDHSATLLPNGKVLVARGSWRQRLSCEHGTV